MYRKRNHDAKMVGFCIGFIALTVKSIHKY